jgi:phosphoribosylanthranilate isomerase
MMRTRVKICCIATREEAAMAINAGADLVGLVGPMPSGPGPIDLATAASIARGLPPGVASVLLSSATELDRLVGELDLVRPAVLQLVDAVEPEVLEALQRQGAGTRLLQVLHVQDAAVVARARALSSLVDGFLLDSGRPEAAIKELGGTGRVHDWAVSRQVVDAVDRPVFLAGGLNPANIAQAIAEVRPFGVDLCSGIRPAGRLDPDLLLSFMRNVKNADRERTTP